MQEFRTLTLAKAYFKVARNARLPHFAKNQIERAALSVVLNLAEGSSRPSLPERFRYYRIAMGSYRESNSIAELYDLRTLITDGDILGRHLTSLIQSGHRPPAAR